MAAITRNWTENQTLRSAATIAAGDSSSDRLDIKDDATIGGADIVRLFVDYTKGSSSGITVEVFESVDGGTTDTDVPMFERSYTASAKFVLVVRDAANVLVNITNDDGSNATGNIAIKYAAAEWLST
ncbi:MAG: hypothetical protein QNJ62_05130 [Methyloceanibacter sp.]|nr:hypothetical protein [Methyloceanibacter sp.]